MIRKKDLDNKITEHSTFLQKQISNLRQRVLTSEQLTTKFQNQLQCAVKGHDFVFEKVEYYTVVSFPGYIVQENKDEFRFKCTNCDLTITKTADELTPTEKKALKDLGILEEKDEQDSKTKTTN